MDGTVDHEAEDGTEEQSGSGEKVLSLSMMQELQKKERTVKIICSESVVGDYSQVPGNDLFLSAVEEGAEIKKACDVRI